MIHKIQSLRIEQFRSLRDLHIESLGRVTLITGRNNTGKSSVLEALRLLTADFLPGTIKSILQSREEDLMDDVTEHRYSATDRYYSLSSLFYNYPAFSENAPHLRISSTGAGTPLELSIGHVILAEQADANGISRLQPRKGDHLNSELVGPVPGIVVNTGDGKPRFFTLGSFGSRQMLTSISVSSIVNGGNHIPCIFVDPYAGRNTASYSALWDSIALSDLEQDVVDALQTIDPAISAVSMVGDESSRASRKAIVKVTGRPRPVALRSFGDGINHLFGIILSLVNASDGLLLIDEFENGLHHSVQVDAWRTIFRLARKLNIQVVATSHSWDCIEAFQVAAAEDPDEGMLIRLTRKGDTVIPTTFSEAELAVVTKDRIEVR